MVLDEAVEAAVKLSQRYMPARQLPDKAVSLLDTACARVAVSQHATPAQVEDRRRRVELLEVEREIVEREADEQYRVRRPRSRSSTSELAAARAPSARRSRRSGRSEKDGARDSCTTRQARAGRCAPTAGDPDAGEGGGSEGRRSIARSQQLARRQGDQPMVFGVVDAGCGGRGRRRLDRHSRSAGWSRTRSRRVLTIADQLKKRVVGQDHAMDAIAKRIQTSRAKLDNPEQAGRRVHAVRPVGRRQDRDRASCCRNCSSPATTS